MPARDWRNAADYADLAGLDLGSLAWEFLRRNPAYQRLWDARDLVHDDAGADAAAARWGLRFAAPPSLSAAQASVFWRAELAPAHVVLLTRSAGEGVSAEALEARSEGRRFADDGMHLRFADGLQALVPPAVGRRAPLAAAAALDADLAVRLSAVGALDRLLRDRPTGSDPLSPLARRRTGQMVRALDGRAAGASYRDIAEHVLASRTLDPQAWRTSTARDVAIRLCRAARRLMGGGYLLLLRRRR